MPEKIFLQSFMGKALSVLFCLLLVVSNVAYPPVAYGQARRFPYGDHIPLQPNSTVRVENLSGHIRVALSQRPDLELIARHHASGTSVGADEYVVEQNGNQIKITTRPADTTGVDLKLNVPEGTNLRLFSDIGDIEITGAAASLLAKTQRGNIQLSLPARINADLALSSSTGTVRSTRSLKSFGVYDPRFLHGQLGEGGAIFAAHTERGQILLTVLGDEMAAPQPPRERDTPSLPREDRDLSARQRGMSPRPELRRPEALPNTPSEIPAKTDESVLRIESQLVTLNANVSTRNGKPILDLKKEDFTLFEDQVQQEIVHFQSVNTPFNLVLLIDLSGSVRDKVNLIRRAAWRFVQATRPEDKVAIVTFTSLTRIVSPLTSDREALRRRIEKIGKPEGGTKFYDALEDTLNEVLDRVRGERNAIVIMSDGVDNALPGVPGQGSEISFEEMFAHVQEFDTIVFPIYLDTEAEAVEDFGPRISRAYSIARKQLNELAEATGGVVFYANRVEDLEGRYEQVAAELGTIYSLGYYPNNNAHDGSFRRISVRVKRDDAVVRARRGYYAKTQS